MSFPSFGIATDYNPNFELERFRINANGYNLAANITDFSSFRFLTRVGEFDIQGVTATDFTPFSGIQSLNSFTLGYCPFVPDTHWIANAGSTVCCWYCTFVSVSLVSRATARVVNKGG